MMTKPGITELDKYVDSRYTLVSMVAKRARMIGTQRRIEETIGNETDTDADKPATQAVNEITDGTLGYIRSEAVERAREYEKERMEAISNFESSSVIEYADEAIDTETE